MPAPLSSNHIGLHHTIPPNQNQNHTPTPPHPPPHSHTHPITPPASQHSSINVPFRPLRLFPVLRHDSLLTAREVGRCLTHQHQPHIARAICNSTHRVASSYSNNAPLFAPAWAASAQTG
ncbi:hypothetical protein EJ05DRAFT_472125 [Pseudovirgaria hyperparasitica]|uniref:Uncharacterized protein n=1 Tax=Pseudovirgaria hyperparasitica TaxID=470096 RepID=A0A6A6WLY7_9PEZI|nr:uncharacterized protein EJ05DRAFT_472125 [Pseudovirgaria hyperparasitica]KAF2763214.1 hypothetical protein EJ05DRAFT_472125 [Pseudovirgaria hyperparasitica]